MKRLTAIAIAALLVGCAKSGSGAPEAAPVGAQASDLYGTTPEQMLAAPDFSAVNYTGDVRGRDFLVGAPTVLWFFPMSGTPG